MRQTPKQRKRLPMVIGVMAMLGILLCACGTEPTQTRLPTEASPEPPTVSGEIEESSVPVPDYELETLLGTLKFPGAVSQQLQYSEHTEDGMSMLIFSMRYEDTAMELFRIYCGDDSSGSPLGYLQLDEGQVSLRYSVCAYAEEDFADEAQKNLYHSMMGGLDTVLESICSDPRYLESVAVAVGDAREASMRYWTVTLPANVTFEETSAHGYCADFYGTVNGQTVKLYSICLGSMEQAAVMGLYHADGADYPVSVLSYDPTYQAEWTEEELSVIYRMMDSVNDVLQVIMEDANFTEA